MKGIYLLLIFYLFISFSSANSCGDCEIHWANLTNLVLSNGTCSASPIPPNETYVTTNVSYCGCPEMVNTILANATDSLGRYIGPTVSYKEVNLTYFSGLDLSKIPHLVTNMTEVGPDLVMIEYNITLTNIGQVNITGIRLLDPARGKDYSIDKLLPGENFTIDPSPYYIVTPDDVRYCSIKNVALAMGKDRCCQEVGPVLAYADLPLAAKNLEVYLKVYSSELIEYGYSLKEDGDTEDLARFEEMIRIQANRLMVMEDAIKANVSSCQSPPVQNLALIESTDATGSPISLQVAYDTVYSQAHT